MGNSHSSSNSPGTPSVTQKLKESWCSGESSFTGLAPSFIDEKDVSDLKLPLYAFEMHRSTEDDNHIAYKAFLKAYPEYRLTWIIDKLRQTDFARLDRTGETYVDYMGGAMYPESLIRAHTMFLNQNVLGNTHSVSNRYAIGLYARAAY